MKSVKEQVCSNPYRGVHLYLMDHVRDPVRWDALAYIYNPINEQVEMVHSQIFDQIVEDNVLLPNGKTG